MSWTVLLISILLHFVEQSETQGFQKCTPQPTCKECLQSPGCAWCIQTDFLAVGESNERRCDTKESLRSRHCSNIFNRRARLELLKNNSLSDKPNHVIQLQPQNLKLQLRVGVPHTFRVSYKRAEGYPIDLYYLMDLSYSMKDDLDMIKNLGEDIVKTLRTFTKHIRIGFGSFVDKVALPYVSLVKAKKKNPCPRMDKCQPAFSFKSILSLSEDATDFKREVSRQRISGNLDSPEAGFDAIMQAAACEDIIGWKNVTRILVYTSDDTFHIAGDGRLAGIFEPHDGKCHLNSSGFYDGTKFDYPSVGHLSRVLSANNIQLIFAVTEDSVSDYKVLSKLIPQSVVGVLKNDSSNVVQLISEAYNNLSSTIFLEHQGAPQELDVSYQSHCGPDQGSTPWQKKGECMHVKINKQVDFTVRLNISKCLEKETEINLKVKGISESLKISIETLCDCDCKDTEKSSPHCNRNGTLNCGICSCDPGIQGQKCNCEKKGDIASLVESCRQGSSSLLCSGHGRCECGLCWCDGSYSGRHCECDDNSCARYNNKLCGGNGNCKCGNCECFPNYRGDSCECETFTNNCKSEGTSLCSGHGKCECNICKCNQNFTGTHCSHMINSCLQFMPCMQCIATAKVKESCSKHCGVAELFHMKDLKDLVCNTEDFMYEAKAFPDGRIEVRYTDLPRSVDKTMVIIGSSVCGIIFTGLLLIIASRLLLELHYRREFRNFLKAQEQTVWRDTQNPLFKDATTTVVNPMHIQDD